MRFKNDLCLPAEQRKRKKQDSEVQAGTQSSLLTDESQRKSSSESGESDIMHSDSDQKGVIHCITKAQCKRLVK